MSAPEIIKQLVATFAANLDAYKSCAFNEAQARIQFINPMFEWSFGVKSCKPTLARNLALAFGTSVRGLVWDCIDLASPPAHYELPKSG